MLVARGVFSVVVGKVDMRHPRHAPAIRVRAGKVLESCQGEGKLIGLCSLLQCASLLGLSLRARVCAQWSAPQYAGVELLCLGVLQCLVAVR